MKVTNKQGKTVYEFGSMNEFLTYIKTNKTRYPSYVQLESARPDNYKKWYGTRSYDEAIDLCEKGWTDVSVKMTSQLKVLEQQKETQRQIKTYLSQAGFQAIIPLWLVGTPQNMMAQKFVTPKRKIVTITKSVGFRGDEKSWEIQQESMKTLMLIRMLESQGYRVNLNVINTWVANNKTITLKIRLKSAGERLNISKIAFPMCHPSMLRRLIFRFREIIPEMAGLSTIALGASQYDKKANEHALEKEEIFIPSFMKLTMDQIKTMADVELGDPKELIQKVK